MSIAEREREILRIKKASAYSELNEQLEKEIQAEVVATVQATLEESLKEEVKVHLDGIEKERPRRSGDYRES